MNNILAKNIIFLREKFGYSQTQLASYLNISPQAVSNYENAKRTIPADVLSKLAILFDVEEYDLYEDNPQQMDVFSAFAFRADEIKEEDMKAIVQFKKIVINYFNLVKELEDEH